MHLTLATVLMPFASDGMRVVQQQQPETTRKKHDHHCAAPIAVRTGPDVLTAAPCDAWTATELALPAAVHRDLAGRRGSRC